MRLLCALLAIVLVSVAEGSRKPNVILILADDLGYECLGANGSTTYQTPVLDQLAATGMRFTECHVQPLCTPTRVELMTGIYNVRNYTNFGHMDPRSVTFANLLKQAGYATAIVGKWQLGANPRDLPSRFGFDEACLWQQTRRPERYRNPGLEINGVEKDWTNGEYGPDLVNDYAIDFITRKKSEPFFLYYPMMLTHSPFTPTPDRDDYHQPIPKGDQGRKKSRNGSSENVNFVAMVAYMDKLIGKLVAHLDRLDLRKDTLMLFVGDNGTGAGIRSRLGDQVVIGGKGSLTHTGTHVPLVANWPGKVPAGQVNGDLISATDFLPTICEATGVKPPDSDRIDGRSFWPQLCGERGAPREWRYCWYAPRGSLVGEFAADHHYKLHRNGDFYDLREDPDEKRPLQSASLPEEARAGRAKLQAVLDRFATTRPSELKTPDAPRERD